MLIGCLFFLCLCYNLAFKKTINEISSNKKNILQYENLSNAPLQLKQLELQLNNLNDCLYDENTHENQEVALLEKANTLIKGQKLKITELPHSDLYTKDGFTIKTQTIVIQGTFNEMLTFLHNVEKERSLGKICSVDFYSQKESGSGAISVKMKIFFQTIIQDKRK
jgi:hypothetical protein